MKKFNKTFRRVFYFLIIMVTIVAAIYVLGRTTKTAYHGIHSIAQTLHLESLVDMILPHDLYGAEESVDAAVASTALPQTQVKEISPPHQNLWVNSGSGSFPSA